MTFFYNFFCELNLFINKYMLMEIELSGQVRLRERREKVKLIEIKNGLVEKKGR